MVKIKRSYKIPAFLWLSFSVVYTMLLPLSFLISAVYIRHSREELLAQKNVLLQKIIITPEDLRFVSYTGKDEILYRGRMYDLKVVSIKDGNIEMLALADEKETTLHDISSKYASGMSNEKESMQVIPTLFYYYMKNNTVFETEEKSSLNTRPYDDLVFKGPFPDVPVPPPDLC